MNLALTLCLFLPAAPAPLPKPLTPITYSDVVGTWRMNWCGSTWHATFSENGQYTCWDERSSWVGHWHLKDGVLTVREWPGTGLNANYSGHIWKASLKRSGLRGLDGAANHPGSMSLLRLSQAR